MQVGRQQLGGSAVMILEIDNKASKTVIDELKAIPEIKRVREVDFE